GSSISVPREAPRAGGSWSRGRRRTSPAARRRTRGATSARCCAERSESPGRAGRSLLSGARRRPPERPDAEGAGASYLSGPGNPPPSRDVGRCAVRSVRRPRGGAKPAGVSVHHGHSTGARMVTGEDLESFLIRMDLDWEEVDDGMYLVRGRNSGLPMVVHHTDTLLLIRLKVMDMPSELPGPDLYRTLLELNATDVIHGAYGI